MYLCVCDCISVSRVLSERLRIAHKPLRPLLFTSNSYLNTRQTMYSKSKKFCLRSSSKKFCLRYIRKYNSCRLMNSRRNRSMILESECLKVIIERFWLKFGFNNICKLCRNNVVSITIISCDSTIFKLFTSRMKFSINII